MHSFFGENVWEFSQKKKKRTESQLYCHLRLSLSDRNLFSLREWFQGLIDFIHQTGKKRVNTAINLILKIENCDHVMKIKVEGLYIIYSIRTISYSHATKNWMHAFGGCVSPMTKTNLINQFSFESKYMECMVFKIQFYWMVAKVVAVWFQFFFF